MTLLGNNEMYGYSFGTDSSAGKIERLEKDSQWRDYAFGEISTVLIGGFGKLNIIVHRYISVISES